MEKKRIVLFDFDGTIGDTVGPIVDILNSLSSRFKYQQIDDRTFERLRNQRNQDALKATGIPPHRVLMIASAVKREMRKKVSQIKPVRGMEKVLADLVRSGHRIGIVTTGSKRSVEAFLAANNLKNFEFIYAGRHFFKKDRILKHLLEKHRFSAERVIYVGDQTSDVEAARKVGIKVVAVGWGFNSETILRRSNPDAFVSSPSGLVNKLQSL